MRKSTVKTEKLSAEEERFAKKRAHFATMSDKNLSGLLSIYFDSLKTSSEGLFYTKEEAEALDENRENVSILLDLHKARQLQSPLGMRITNGKIHEPDSDNETSLLPTGNFY